MLADCEQLRAESLDAVIMWDMGRLKGCIAQPRCGVAKGGAALSSLDKRSMPERATMEMARVSGYWGWIPGDSESVTLFMHHTVAT
jgi:hypothetical protein